MDVSILGAAGDAALALLEPFRLAMLVCGVLLGLFLGIVPGIGGLAGMALLLPFTYTMDAYAAFALILGMVSVTNTSDTIPAVLFGVPGSAGAQATVMDGNPMAKRGEAGRALSAAYGASLLGGLFGALMLAVTIPLLRPVMLYIASPELLSFSLLGIAMVAVLSGSAVLRGLIAAGFGIMLSMVGVDTQAGLPRWTMGTDYLWDGLPLIPVVMGLFALPELADLAIQRMSVAKDSKFDARSGMLRGIRDVVAHRWLVARCGALGAALGAVPGIGSGIIDWIAYGYASESLKGAKETFGKGDVRGVIAPEAANNSVTAGSLVPTLAFGIPGSAVMSILLSVFLIHGLVPGPTMLTTNLDLTYGMVWSIALANILGAGICFAFSGQLAKVALLRYTLIMPPVLTFIYVGAFQASSDWGDLYTLLGFAVLGWAMKQLRWPRPPLMLGFVLGALIERYMFISTARYGLDWLTRPVTLTVLTLAALVLLLPLLRRLRGSRSSPAARAPTGFRFRPADLSYVFAIASVAALLVATRDWPRDAAIGPQIIGWAVLAFALMGLVAAPLRRKEAQETVLAGDDAAGTHMDTVTDHSNLSTAMVLRRAAVFILYLVFFMASMAVVGVLPTIPLLVAGYLRLEGRESWVLVIGQSVVLVVLVYLIFDRFLHTPWPATLIGEWIPALRVIPSV